MGAGGLAPAGAFLRLETPLELLSLNGGASLCYIKEGRDGEVRKNGEGKERDEGGEGEGGGE